MTPEMLDGVLRSELEMMLILKMKDFREHNLRSITKDNLLDYLFNVKWKRRDKLVTCDIVNDIFDVPPSQVFAHLGNEGIENAASLRIEDFSDLIWT